MADAENAKAASVAGWMAKATSDLATAAVLIEGAEPHLDTGVYHCQQAAEKAIKAWLTFRKMPFPKTHDLDALLLIAMTDNRSLSALTDLATELTPYATEFRYPGELLHPSPEDAASALRCAREVVSTIRRSLQQH
jgi:HEPN domain-containing protein